MKYSKTSAIQEITINIWETWNLRLENYVFKQNVLFYLHRLPLLWCKDDRFLLLPWFNINKRAAVKRPLYQTTAKFLNLDYLVFRHPFLL